MTKSTITREESVQAVFDLKVGYRLGFADIEILKRVARMALAAMDSEPVEMPLDYLQGHKDGLEWASQLAEANHPETGDWLYDDPIELAKAIRIGPDMPPAQPVADSEPDRNPVLAYADSYRDMAKQGVESVPIWSVITDLERNIAPLYRHAQPAPLVPEVDADDNFYSWFGREWAENYQHNQYTTAAKQMLGVMAESAWIAATERQRQKQSVSVPDVKIYEDVPYGVGRFKTHRDCYCDGWNACRAAMLNHPSSIQPNTDAATGTEIKHPSSNSPVIPEGYVMVPKEPTPEMLEVINEAIKSMRGSAATYARVLAVAPQLPGSESATVPGKWIPVSERMPEVGDIVLTAMGGVVNVGEMECSAANCRFFTSVISGRELPATYWMPLPAGPKEDIKALIPLVSRNEQEGK